MIEKLFQMGDAKNYQIYLSYSQKKNTYNNFINGQILHYMHTFFYLK